MKIILSLLASMVIITSCKNGWSVAERNEFVNTCAQAAAANMGQEKAKAYCSCMQQKLEAKFPKSADANKALNAPNAMQTPEMTAMVQSCLNGGNTNANNNNGNGYGGGVLGGVNNNNNNNAGGNGTWSKEDEDKWMNICATNPNNKELCSCVLQKLEGKYASYEEMNTKGTSEEGQQLGLQCKEELNGNGFNNNNNDNNTTITGGNWTREQHQQFVQGCSISAQQQQGMTAQEANSYCDCITTKIEQKYTFEQASNLTPHDLQTTEWQQAMLDCGARRQ
jgi:hypothetical protein